MDKLKIIAEGYLPFSTDGPLLNEFKSDVTEIMEYLVDTDFASQAFRITLADEIELDIVDKWRKRKYTFNLADLEMIKNEILAALSELCYYISIDYVHALPDGRLIFNNDSEEAGEKLRNELQPKSLEIRTKVCRLLEELYKF